jgi:hypothetical protein
VFKRTFQMFNASLAELLEDWCPPGFGAATQPLNPPYACGGGIEGAGAEALAREGAAAEAIALGFLLPAGWAAARTHDVRDRATCGSRTVLYR